MSNDFFLVQVNAEPGFYTNEHDGEVFVTPFPGYALQLPFEEANSLARDLRVRGFEGAAVMNLTGSPPTVGDLASVRKTTLYQVYFSEMFFTGLNLSGRDMGSKDRGLAVAMPQEVALEAAKRLRRKGHTSARIIEVDAAIVNAEEEANKLFRKQ